MTRPSIGSLATLAAAAALFAAGPAFGHTGIGAHAPGAFAAGFAHPLLGLDHLLAMVAVGLWAATIGGRAVLALCLAFPAAMVVGAVVGTTVPTIPGVEAGIAASVLALGLAVALAFRPRLPVAAGLAAAFALAHGFAHGAELPAGANALAYGGGFVLATLALHLAGAAVGWAATRGTAPGLRLGLRGAGASIAAVGLVFLLA